MKLFAFFPCVLDFPNINPNKTQNLNNMSDCNISIPFTDSVSVTIAKAKSAIESQNGTFNGDENSGNFEVTFLVIRLKEAILLQGKR